MDNRKLILFLFFLFIIPLSYALEECRGTMDQDQVPCLVLLPIDTSLIPCSTITTAFYNNASTLLYNQTMNEYNQFTCNASFDPSRNNSQPILGTYTFFYTTGDSGSIIIEVGNLNFFNLLVYLVFSTIGIVFMVFNHVFRDQRGSAIVYGWIATAVFAITGSIILSPDFNVISNVSLIIDADFYLAALSFVMALYTGIVSINIKRNASTGATESVF